MTDTIELPRTKTAPLAAPAPPPRSLRADEAGPSRSGAIDAVRVLGIVAVVVGHSWNLTAVNLATYTWHVPLFFFLSGYLWRARRQLRDELRIRWRTLARPYAAWFVLVGVALVGLSAIRGNPPDFGFFLGPLYGGYLAVSPYTTFWFVSALFATTLLTRVLWNAGRIWFASGIAIGIAAGALAGPALARTPLSLGSALGCLPLVASGMLARRIRPRLDRPVVVGSALILTCAAAIALRASASIDIRSGDYGTPVASLAVATGICFGLVLLAEAAFERLPLLASRLASRLGRAGLAVVLLHPLFLWIVYSTQMDALGFLYVLSVPWLVGLCLLRFPTAARILLGLRGQAPVTPRPGAAR